jgi:hypothetical protein
MVNFIPDIQAQAQLNVPYIEDVKASEAPGYATRSTPEALQKQIVELLGQMEAIRVQFIPGTLDGKPKRYGYQLHFNLNGVAGRIDIFALPMRKETPAKKRQVLAQALFVTRDWLKGELYRRLYHPSASPLMPYLLSPGGQTITEIVMSRHPLPLLTGGE